MAPVAFRDQEALRTKRAKLHMVTSNHIHVLVRDNGETDVIPRSIQLIAGRTGQEFNQRKNRKGAYWEDRYHATAVETDGHLVQCLVYLDMDMGFVPELCETPLTVAV